MLVLSESVRTDKDLQQQIAAMGETVATLDPRQHEGHVWLVEWILAQCVGIEKRVVFVRHGQAEHNVTHNWELRDPALTLMGTQQCQQLAQGNLVEAMRAEAIVVSPMR